MFTVTHQLQFQKCQRWYSDDHGNDIVQRLQIDHSGLHSPCLQKYCWFCLPLSGEWGFHFKRLTKNCRATSWAGFQVTTSLSQRSPEPQPQLPGAGPPAVGGCWRYHRNSYLQPARNAVVFRASPEADNVFGLYIEEMSEFVIGQTGVCEIQEMSATLLSMAFLPAEYPGVWVSLSAWSLPLLVVKCSKLSIVTFQGHDLAYFLILLSLSFLFYELEMYYPIEGSSHRRVLWGLQEITYS